MIKVFISQPMRGKSKTEIRKERQKMIEILNSQINDEFEILDTIFDFGEDAKPLQYLAKSLDVLATADVAYFGRGWESTRGCKIEHTCAKEYGIKTMYF